MIKALEKFDKFWSFTRLFCVFLTILILFSTCFDIQVKAEKNNYNPDYTLPVVVSLGDSYSSGEGIEPFYCQDLSNKEKTQKNDWLAHRSQKSWPGMLMIPGLNNKTATYKDTNWFFVAASGAETKHLNYEQDKPYARGIGNQYYGTAYLPPQLDIFDNLEANSVDYVTLSLGGNDAGFSDIIKQAVIGSTYLNTSSLSDDLSNVWADFYSEDGIQKDLYNAYKDVEKKAGKQAQIIVAGYPQLLNPDGGGAFSLEEATEINRAVSNFNIAIESIVEQCSNEGMKICFVSVESAFSGHEAYSNNPYIEKVHLMPKDEDLKNIQVASAYSMHPTYNGAIEYAKCVNEKIEQLAQEELEKMEEEALNASDKERDVILVLDSSGSMSGMPMNETKNASYKFIDTVLENDANVGIVSYDSSATVCSVPTDSKQYLNNAINGIYSGGGTNIESGLKMADAMLSKSKAEKKIIVLMSDGEPNEGKVDQDLTNYADKLKEKGYYIYTLGFFSAISNKSYAQELMEGIASEGCHYEVSDAESLVFFFGDIADQITGTKYMYIRIACPVDVTVTCGDEDMTSKNNYSSIRTSFGSMTFEESTNEDEDSNDNDDRIKILRLKEGVDYDVKIEGNGRGKMDYSIAFMDEDGEYSDIRDFSNIKINKRTEIDTVASVSKSTYMYVDEDGDGKYDYTYKAEKDSKAELIDYSYLIYLCAGFVVFIILLITILYFIRRSKIKKYM